MVFFCSVLVLVVLSKEFVLISSHYVREFIWPAALYILAAAHLIWSVQCSLFVINFILGTDRLVLKSEYL